MSFSELMQIVAAEGNEPDDEADKLLKTFRRQARALLRTVRALVEVRGAVDHDDVADLHDKLQDALTHLAEAYELEE